MPKSGMSWGGGEKCRLCPNSHRDARGPVNIMLSVQRASQAAHWTMKSTCTLAS